MQPRCGGVGGRKCCCINFICNQPTHCCATLTFKHLLICQTGFLDNMNPKALVFPLVFFKETDKFQNQNISINRRPAACPKNHSFFKPMRRSLEWNLSTNGCFAKSRLKKKKNRNKRVQMNTKGQ